MSTPSNKEVTNMKVVVKKYRKLVAKLSKLYPRQRKRRKEMNDLISDLSKESHENN